MIHRTLSMRKIIREKIGSIAPHLYYESAHKESPYPYVVYTLDDSNSFDSVEDFVLEIDAWDKPIDGSTFVLEELIGDIDKVLNYSTVFRDGRSYRFYRQNRRSIRDSDKRLKRRQLIYQIKVMGVE